ncbi:hypothetical protein EVAR_52135_1 [Eumeta japonica]|uniref:Endonuclease/exonuclease/phosphatase domain-containing protein n=1 Tax=Eumeta variegata TaxID=151549 RepID=A0A4C1XNF5_EUMVA|nr:hypothetical protein EVAR_52135_1 [Eumeta japonica]
MKATSCRLAIMGHGTLVIVSVYLPSPKKLLRRDLRALLALEDAVIVFGDFSCKASDRVTQLLIIMEINSINSRTDLILKLSRLLGQHTIPTSQPIDPLR